MRRATVFCLTLTALMLFSRATNASEIQWLGSINQAKQIAAQSGKLVLVHFWSTTCPPCVRLEREVYSQPGIGQVIGQSYVPVKINAEKHPALMKRYQLRFVPADIVMTSGGDVISRTTCPMDRTKYLAGLNQIAVAQRAKQAGPYAGIASQAGRPPVAVAAAPPARPAPTHPAIQAHSGDGDGQRPNYFAGSAGAVPSGTKAFGGAGASGAHVSGYEPFRRPPTIGSAGSVPAQPPSTPDGQPYNPTSQPGGQFAQAAQFKQPLYRKPPTGPATLSQPAIKPPTPGAPPVGQPIPSNVPAGQVPLALEGTCPVELVENERWVRGDKRWGAIHRGRLYLFMGQAQQQRFLSNPDRFSPVLSGNDPVLAIDQQHIVSGQRRHGLYYKQRVYLFASEDTLSQFHKNPERYLDGVRFAEASDRSSRRY